jgi:hypothetical protein
MAAGAGTTTSVGAVNKTVFQLPASISVLAGVSAGRLSVLPFVFLEQDICPIITTAVMIIMVDKNIFFILIYFYWWG